MAAATQIVFPTSHDDRAYRDYVAYCARMDVKPMEREWWVTFVDHVLNAGGLIGGKPRLSK